jgi:hypothetical protein
MPPMKSENWEWFSPPPEEETFSIRKPPEDLGVRTQALITCAQRGRLAVNGTVARLRVCRLPQGISTTREEFHRYIEELNRT